MSRETSVNTSDYVVPLNINGLEGRMLVLPAPNNHKREILLLYGSHSSLERMFTLAEELNTYGRVTMPDWPGFGGMDAFFKVGKKPNFDNLADYLAAFIKLRYKRKRLTIIGLSYGLAVATRMLQKYPDLARKVDLVVSIVGFVHREDFRMSKSTLLGMRGTGLMLRGRITSKIARLVINGPIVQATYTLLANRNQKMIGADKSELEKRIAFERILWRINDMRTYFYTGYTLLTVDLCNADQRVDVPLYHVAVAGDQFFNNHVVEQHMAIIYKSVDVTDIDIGAHMPTIIATAKEVAPFIPPKIRRLLAQKI
jgi:pimeloyl-ACP methyl ester carboxylesterase